MENKRTLRSIFLIVVGLTSLASASGTDDKSSLHANKRLPRSTSTSKKLTVFRNENIELGTTVMLNCTNTKIAWQDMIFVIWKIHLQDKECIIAVAKNDSAHDTCLDGKKQNRTADGAYHLIIPNFSFQDEGNYTCDTSYPPGGLMEMIKVTAFARPQLSGWLESDNGHTVAVCEATSKPAASIRWETQWNLSFPITEAYESTGPLSTVISRLHLPQHASHRNITCEAITSDLKHNKTRFSNFKFRATSWPFNIYSLFCSIIPLSIGLYIMCKKITKIRKLCSKPDTQQPNDPDEFQQCTRYMPRGMSTVPKTQLHTHIRECIKDIADESRSPMCLL